MQARCHDPGGELYVASCREAAEFFDVLAATARLRILATLARASDAVCSCVFVDGLGLAASTVSHHLERLIAHGFVVAERRGTWRYYSLAAHVVDHVTHVLRALLDQPGGRVAS